MLDQFLVFVDKVNGVIWGPAALVFLGLVGIYLTVGTKFVHIKNFFKIIKQSFSGLNDDKDEKQDGDLTSLQSMFVSLSSVIGMGSVVGVASALISGGPGALLWMWIAAFIGMVIKYSEIILIVMFREQKSDGTYVGGPALYVRKGLGLKYLGEVIVVLMVLVCLASAMIQSNVTVSNMTNIAPHLSNYLYILAAVNVVIVGIVIVGGVKRIGSVAEKLIPFMSLFYIIVATIVIIIHYKDIIPAVQLVFSSAFSPAEAGAGFAGYGIMKAMQYGIARGFFVSGAGQAVFTVSHAPARVKNPVEQAVFGVTEVFLVTVVCTFTALALLTSGVELEGQDAGTIVAQVFGDISPILGIAVGIATILFAYSTVIGLGYVGESQLSTITSTKKARIYRYIFLVAVYIGGIGGLKAIWDLTDVFLGLVMFVNLIVMLLLSKKIFKASNDYWGDEGQSSGLTAGCSKNKK
uniref:alanine/glycine:cation symporter family protein n=1 Tax=Nosocomiicoccus ampullae TaxID=489910 RepID=UPI00082EF08C|nr:amino acid carrier protein [Nosocomiicoccus ampullae]